MAPSPHRVKKAKAYLTPIRHSRCPIKSPHHNSLFDNVFLTVGGSWFKFWVWASLPSRARSFSLSLLGCWGLFVVRYPQFLNILYNTSTTNNFEVTILGMLR